MIAYTSRGTGLRPGGVIGSGTVPTGCLFEHYATHPGSFRGWLQPGDEVHLAIEQSATYDSASSPDPSRYPSAPASDASTTDPCAQADTRSSLTRTRTSLRSPTS